MSRLFVWGSPFLVVVLGLSACGKPDESTEKAAVVPAEDVAVPVHVSPLESATFVDRLQLYGRIDARNAVRVTAEMMGQIEGLPFDDGKRVSRGQTLARINARVVEAQLKQAEASFRLAEAEKNRTEKLVEKGLSTPQQLDVTRAQMDQASASLELVKANLEKAVIRSPIDGIVTNVVAKRGEITAPGAPILEVVDIRDVEVKSDLPESDVSLMKEGITVDVHVDAYPTRVFPAVVRHVGLSANRTTRTFPISLSVDNKDAALRPGMLASLDLTRQEIKDALVIPRDAVIDDVDEKYVYILEGERSRRRIIELGATRGRFVIVKSGISVGDTLIVLGHRQVVDGQKIEVVDSQACCRDQLAPKSAGTQVGEITAPATATQEL